MVNAQRRFLAAVLAGGVALSGVILFTTLPIHVAAPVFVLIGIACAYVLSESRYYRSWRQLHLRRVIGAVMAYSAGTALFGVWLAGGIHAPDQAALGFYEILGLVLFVSFLSVLVSDSEAG